jgi:ABC-type spermidine/putrescine transport system permease subunit II
MNSFFIFFFLFLSVALFSFRSWCHYFFLVAPFLFVVALSFPERRRRSKKKESYSFNYFGVCSLVNFFCCEPVGRRESEWRGVWQDKRQ